MPAPAQWYLRRLWPAGGPRPPDRAPRGCAVVCATAPTRAAAATVWLSELDHDAGAPHHLARAQVGEPHAALVGALISAADADSVAHQAGGRAGVAERRRDPARSAPVRHVRMPEGELGPPGNPVLRHVLKVQLHVPLIEVLPRFRGEVGGAAWGGGAVDRRQQRQVAAGVVHEAAAEGDRILVVIKP